MIISGSQVSFSSVREAQQYTRSQESLTYWQNGRDRQSINSSSEQGNRPLHFRFQVMSSQMQLNRSFSAVNIEISQQAKDLQHQSISEVSEEEQLTVSDENLSLQIALVGLLVERVTGKKLKLFDPKELQEQNSKAEKHAGELHDKLAKAKQVPEESVGWGLRYEATHEHYESEKVSFSAQAIVKTADGRQIELEVELNLSREFVAEEKITLLAGDALKDPLVVNFNGNAVELTEEKFAFDIDVDGQADQVSFVKSGSGFLVYDRNGNNQVDDGSELFGAVTGDGFAELASYDQDNNRWIDENDAIYQHLKVWTKSPEGEDRLIAIAQQDIGAIYLDKASTEFALKDDQNQQHGQLRSTGIYLKESGGAGTVQQIDLVA